MTHFAIVHIFYFYKSISMNSGTQIPDIVLTKLVHNFPLHPSFVSTLHENTLSFESCSLSLTALSQK